MEHVEAQLDAAEEREEMTDKKQPEALAFCWATELAMTQQPVTLSVTEAREVSAEMQRLHAGNTTLQQGYAAARLEIESLQARIKTMAEEHADELMVAHLDGGMRAAQVMPESIRSILVRCRNFIDTTKVPAYPAGADLADEIDVLLAAQPAGAQQPGTAYAALPDADRDYMRKVVAVAVTMLFDSYKEDVMRVFSTGELSEFVTITAAMRVEKVEDIYRRAWDLLSLPARASHGQAPAQAAVAHMQRLFCGQEQEHHHG